MSIQKLVRVDYRLIHGQIVAKRIKVRSVDRIIVAEDELANDDFMVDIYKMAVPNQKVEIVKLDELQKALDNSNDRVMIIFKTIKNVKKALSKNIILKELNIGAIESSSNRILITSGVSLSKEEYEDLLEMQKNGIYVYIQSIPDSAKIELSKINNKIKSKEV